MRNAKKDDRIIPFVFQAGLLFSLRKMVGVYSDALQQSKLENEEGEDGHDVTFKIGDSWKAPWRDGGLYDGKVVFEGGKIINTCIYIQYIELLF